MPFLLLLIRQSRVSVFIFYASIMYNTLQMGKGCILCLAVCDFLISVELGSTEVSSILDFIDILQYTHTNVFIYIGFSKVFLSPSTINLYGIILDFRVLLHEECDAISIQCCFLPLTEISPDSATLFIEPALFSFIQGWFKPFIA